MTDPLLELCNVSVSLGHGRARTVVVDNVSLTVDNSEIVGLVGASGAGKSTIARLVGGLLAADSGSIRLAGADLIAASRDRRQARRISTLRHLIFQDPYTSLSPTFRVAELVAEPLKIHSIGSPDERARRVADALHAVGLEPPARFLDRKASELSGGERQRVALARALSAHPALIVADEPTGMLDAQRRAELVELMRAIAAEREIGWLFITHDLAQTQDFCHRLIVMHDGAVVEEGPTDAVLNAPVHSATTALLGAVNTLSKPASTRSDTNHECSGHERCHHVAPRRRRFGARAATR